MKAHEDKPTALGMDAIDRPRERMVRQGPETLSNAELMAIIFGTGRQGKNVLELSKEILDNSGHNMAMVARLTVDDLRNQFSGIGMAKACTLVAALELGRRSARDEIMRQDKALTSSSDAYEMMRWRMAGLDHEEFWVLLLSRAMKVIRPVRVAQGGVAATVVDPKIIMRQAVTSLASSIMLFHNHPSGQLMPSAADDAITRKLVDAGKLLDINVVDHIIVTDHGYYSYNDNGRL